jgi:hypothetical protein
VTTEAFQLRLVQLGMLSKDRVDRNIDWTHGHKPARPRMVLYEMRGPTKEEQRKQKLNLDEPWPAPDLMEEALTAPHPSRSVTDPRPFSEEFVRVLHAALKDKHIALDRAMQLLGLDKDEVAQLFRMYQLEVPN